MIIYKIRNKKTGEFSKGKGFNRWSKTGKTWNAAGHVSNHLSSLYDDYVDAEVVVFEIVEREIIPIDEWKQGIAERRIKRESSKERRQIAAQIQAKQAELERLQSRVQQLSQELDQSK